jgi:hypothetical protein
MECIIVVGKGEVHAVDGRGGDDGGSNVGLVDARAGRAFEGLRLRPRQGLVAAMAVTVRWGLFAGVPC